MVKNFSDQETPKTGEKWKNLSNGSRIKMIAEELKKDKLYNGFEVIEAQIMAMVLKIERAIPANEKEFCF